jgi:hypothetical protein
MSKFVATRNKGFAMTFENNYTISVQWGTENYCEKRITSIHPTDPMKHKSWNSLSAEIAVFNDDEMINISSDGIDAVIGWLGTEDVAKVIAIVSSAKSVGEIQTKIKKLGI